MINLKQNISYDIRAKIINDLKLSSDKINRGLSYNAISNAAEFFADAISEMFNSKKPRPIAKAVGTVVNYYLGGLQ